MVVVVAWGKLRKLKLLEVVMASGLVMQPVGLGCDRAEIREEASAPSGFKKALAG